MSWTPSPFFLSQRVIWIIHNGYFFNTRASAKLITSMPFEGISIRKREVENALPCQSRFGESQNWCEVVEYFIWCSISYKTAGYFRTGGFLFVIASWNSCFSYHFFISEPLGLSERMIFLLLSQRVKSNLSRHFFSVIICRTVS